MKFVGRRLGAGLAIVGLSLLIGADAFAFQDPDALNPTGPPLTEPATTNSAPEPIDSPAPPPATTDVETEPSTTHATRGSTSATPTSTVDPDPDDEPTTSRPATAGKPKRVASPNTVRSDDPDDDEDGDTSKADESPASRSSGARPTTRAQDNDEEDNGDVSPPSQSNGKTADASDDDDDPESQGVSSSDDAPEDPASDSANEPTTDSDNDQDGEPNAIDGDGIDGEGIDGEGIDGDGIDTAEPLFDADAEPDSDPSSSTDFSGEADAFGDSIGDPDSTGDSTNDAGKEPGSDPSGDGQPRELAFRIPAGRDYPTFIPVEHVAPMQRVQTIAVSAMAVIAAAAAPAAAARAGRGSSGVKQAHASNPASGATPAGEGEYAEIYTGDAAFAAAASIEPGRGDRSRTWHAPMTDPFDRTTKTIPTRLAPLTPLLSNLVADGTWARAVAGSIAAVLPLGGIALGVAAGFDAQGSFLPPSLFFVAALMVLGVLDAGAGFVASLAFAGTTMAVGGLPNTTELRALLGLIVLWFAPVIIAGATRPLRRELDRSFDTWLDRIGDVIIGSMTAVWCSQGFTYGQNALTGLQLPIADQYVMLGWIAFAALVARYLLESAVAWWYPVRLAATDPGEPDQAPLIQRGVSLGARAGLFLFVASGFFRIDAKIVFATFVMLFGVFAYWDGVSSRFPNSARLHRWAPGGFPMAIILVVATDRITAWLGNAESDPQRRMLHTFVLVAVPVLLSTLVAVIGRDGERPQLRRWHRFASVPLLVLSAHYMFGLFLSLPVPSLFRAA